jgi:hypothetical protein
MVHSYNGLKVAAPRSAHAEQMDSAPIFSRPPPP